MAINYDIGGPLNPVWSGTTVSLQFNLTTVVDTTGWTTVLTFKKTRNDNSPLKQYNVAGSSDGHWAVTMTRADTLLFPAPGTYEYDFERTDPGSESVLTWGKFQVDRKVNS